MAKQSLFSVLSRSPWWLSLVIGALLFVALQALFPVLVAVSASLPFVAVALYAAWRQWRVPDEAAAADVLKDLRVLSWDRFSALMAEAFRHDGYEVTAADDDAVDFKLRRGARTTLASCKRWKAARTGVGPLRELTAAGESQDADDCIYVTAGELSDQAQAFADQHRVRVLTGVELARLLGRDLTRRAA